jgi:primosomal protein N' (replication factor Y) (superfamily II helicase)
MADSRPAADRLVEVALPVPLFRTFTYLVDEGAGAALVPGSRVVVPFRNRREVGIVVGIDVPPRADVKYRRVAAIPDDRPAIAPPLLATCYWLSDHYVVPLGVTLRAVLPGRLSGAGTPSPSSRTRRVASVARPLESLLERDRLFARAPRQRATYEMLEGAGGTALVAHLVAKLPAAATAVRALAARGLVTLREESDARDPFAARAPAPAMALTPTLAQRAAIDAVAAARPGDVVLLHGVTGSGKTLVYLEVLRRVVHEERRSAIVLVPEIALTPQTVDRFRAVFGDQVAVLHSALGDGERLDAWRALRDGRKRIAVGARSAIFAPLEGVGAIIVDEEHEGSYKQNEAPRYHARDVAIVRARQEGAVAVLGSATPSLESWVRASSGGYRLASLPDRVGGGTLPDVRVVDLLELSGARGAPPEHHDTAPSPTAHHHSTPSVTASAPPAPQAPPASPASHGATNGGAVHASHALPPGSPDLRPPRLPAPPQRTTPLVRDPFRRVISEPLERAIEACLARGEQTILLLNRRGYSSFVQCTACGDVATCPDCSISLTYHRAPESLLCHYCRHIEPPRDTCARCGSATVRERGLGTQQVERLVGERFPAVRLARMDVDTTSGKWAHAEILDRVAAGEVDILLGTQMIAKGLDFPNVTLVGVVDADVGMNLPDFRAAERTFQLLAQVAGRAGRGVKPGEVIVQTRMRDHHAVRCAVHHDFHAFVEQELAHRASPPYPPTLRLANLVFSGPSEEATEALAQHATAWIRRLVAARPAIGVTVVGPAPCPIDRIKQRWRWHTLLKAARGAPLTRLARYFAERYEVAERSGLRAVIDRDPVSLL